MQEIDCILKELGVNLLQPFLTPEFISLAKNIPIEQKITGPNDLVKAYPATSSGFNKCTCPSSDAKERLSIQFFDSQEFLQS